MATQTPKIPMHKVESSMIGEIGYDAGSKILAVTFKNGGTYHYEGIPAELVTALTSAKSIGKYFLSHIKPKYTGGRI